MINTIATIIAMTSCVALFAFLAVHGWKDMKSHEPKKTIHK